MDVCKKIGGQWKALGGQECLAIFSLIVLENMQKKAPLQIELPNSGLGTPPKSESTPGIPSLLPRFYQNGTRNVDHVVSC